MIFDLDVSGDERAKQRLQRMARRAEHSRPLFEDMVDELAEGERRWWRSPRGWADLAESTKERKARQNLPLRTMRASGELEKFLTRRRRTGRDERHTITRDTLRFGIPGGRHDVYYGRFHQKGQGNPKRRVVVLTARTRKQLAKVTRRHITS